MSLRCAVLLLVAVGWVQSAAPPYLVHFVPHGTLAEAKGLSTVTISPNGIWVAITYTNLTVAVVNTMNPSTRYSFTSSRPITDVSVAGDNGTFLVVVASGGDVLTATRDSPLDVVASVKGLRSVGALRQQGVACGDQLVFIDVDEKGKSTGMRNETWECDTVFPLTLSRVLVSNRTSTTVYEGREVRSTVPIGKVLSAEVGGEYGATDGRLWSFRAGQAVVSSATFSNPTVFSLPKGPHTAAWVAFGYSTTQEIHVAPIDSSTLSELTQGVYTERAERFGLSADGEMLVVVANQSLTCREGCHAEIVPDDYNIPHNGYRTIKNSTLDACHRECCGEKQCNIFQWIDQYADGSWPQFQCLLFNEPEADLLTDSKHPFHTYVIKGRSATKAPEGGGDDDDGNVLTVLLIAGLTLCLLILCIFLLWKLRALAPSRPPPSAAPKSGAKNNVQQNFEAALLENELWSIDPSPEGSPQAAHPSPQCKSAKKKGRAPTITKSPEPKEDTSAKEDKGKEKGGSSADGTSPGDDEGRPPSPPV